MRIAAVLYSCVVALAFGQAPPPIGYRISGTVVDHLTNRPLNHVLVEITSTEKGRGSVSALTDADGHFTFVDVPKGKYQLAAEKRGQMPEGFHSEGGYSTAIVVDGRQNTEGIVFAMRTDAAINGTVMGDDGAPVHGARIQLFRANVIDGEAQTMELAGSSTNSAGQFHLAHLGAGNYYISVQATPWFSQSGLAGQGVVYPVTFYGDTTDADAARVITLQEGGSASVAINLHTVPGIRVKVAEGTNGLVVFVPGPGGTRIPASASLGISAPTPFVGSSPQQRAGQSGGGFQTPYMPTTAEATELMNLAAGRYEIVEFGQNGGMGENIETVDLVDGSTLTFVNTAPSSISGTVILDGSRPRQDHMQVFLNSAPRGGGMTAEIGSDGTFKFPRATHGKLEIHLNAPGLTIASIAAKGAEIAHDNLEVTPGSSVELTIHAISSESLATVNGFAVRNGAGMAGAMVLLLPQDLNKLRFIRRDQSDADGSFTLAGVLPGNYTLVAIDDGDQLAYKTEAVIKPYLQGGLALSVPLKRTEPVRVQIQTRRR